MTAPGEAERITLLDSLRGFALFGIFIVHAVELFELYWYNPQPGWVHDLIFGFFAGKAFALFALCFGVSFYIIMESAKRRGSGGAGLFAWRLALLLGFGLFHGLVYRGEILQVLALLGFSLLLFDRIRSATVLLALAALFLLQPPLIARAVMALQGVDIAAAPPGYYSDPSLAVMANGNFIETLKAQAWDGAIMKWQFMLESGRCTQIFGLFIIGLLLGRAKVFEHPERHRTTRRVIGAAGLGLWFVLTHFRGELLALVPSTGDSPDMSRMSMGWALGTWASLGLMAAQVAVFFELWRGVGARILGLLAPAGRMTLTLYVGQSVVFTPILYGYGLGLYDDLSQPVALYLGLAAFAVQVALAHLWFRHFRYGPLEWLWRAATRRTLAIPFRRRATGQAGA